jgi:hypothetical protein
MTQTTSYSFYNEFIERYLPTGFTGIDPKDPFMVKMENKLEENNQFFYIADMVQLKVLFTSSGSMDIIGLNPGNVDLSTLFRLTHPNEMIQKKLSRIQLLKTGAELFVKKEGESYISACFKSRNPTGSYSGLLFQGYLFYSGPRFDTVYLILVLTDITHMGSKNTSYHYYFGPDPGFFRYPDEELLRTGRIFSDREFEIIRLIAEGLRSKEIAAKLFLSVNTITTHRRNILKKAAKPTMHDLILDLMELGIL